MKDSTKPKPQRYAVLSRDKRLIKSKPVHKVTQLEAAILDWAIFQGIEDWYMIYMLSHPDALDKGDATIQSLTYSWKNSDKIQKYIEKRTAEIDGIMMAKCRSRVLHELNIKQMDSQIEMSGSKGNAGANNKDGELRGLSDEEMIRELERTFMCTSDPKERASVANAIASYKRRTNSSITEQNVKRFYMPINIDGCRNCQLYVNQRLTLKH